MSSKTVAKRQTTEREIMDKRHKNMWWSEDKQPKEKKQKKAENLDYLLDLLQDFGFVKARQVATARKKASAAGVGVIDWMLTKGIISPAVVTQTMAAHFGLEMVLLSEMKISDEVIACVPGDIARKYRIIPLRKHNGELTIATANPSDLATMDSLLHLLNLEIALQVASEEDIKTALAKYYGRRKRGK